MASENRLTDRRMKALKPTEVEQVLGDGGGLWIRVLPASKGGAINFYYRFTLSGKERRYNCGTYPETTLAAARDRRSAARALVKQGIDPVEREVEQRRSATAAQALAKMEKTVDDLFEDWKRVYLASHHADGGKFAESAYNLDVKPILGAMRVKDVRQPHIVQVIDKLLDRGVKRKANVVLSQMRQMFRHGLGRGLVEADPTIGISKKQAGGKEVPVERNLSLEEIAELGRKLTTCGLHDRMVAGLLLILATGARVGELIKARWDDFDFDHSTWVIPAENSKNSRPHLIHLSAFARRQVDQLRAVKSGEYVFAGKQPDTHISEKSISKAVRDRIRSEPLSRRSRQTQSLMLSGGEWSPHDLRRTMASRMGDLGIAPHVIERCLNHVQQGIVGVYQRQEYLDERRTAFVEWGRALELATAAS